MSEPDLILTVAFFVVAALYSSVGHAGASGYIAAMALLSVAPPIIRPVALALNILVGSIGLVASVPISTWLAAVVVTSGATARAARPPASARRV